MWRSLVAHLTGGQGVAGSNPVIPTKFFTGFRVVPACSLVPWTPCKATRVRKRTDRRRTHLLIACTRTGGPSRRLSPSRSNTACRIIAAPSRGCSRQGSRGPVYGPRVAGRSCRPPLQPAGGSLRSSGAPQRGRVPYGPGPIMPGGRSSSSSIVDVPRLVNSDVRERSRGARRRRSASPAGLGWSASRAPAQRRGARRGKAARFWSSSGRPSTSAPATSTSSAPRRTCSTPDRWANRRRILGRGARGRDPVPGPRGQPVSPPPPGRARGGPVVLGYAY